MLWALKQCIESVVHNKKKAALPDLLSVLLLITHYTFLGHVTWREINRACNKWNISKNLIWFFTINLLHHHQHQPCLCLWFQQLDSPLTFINFYWHFLTKSQNICQIIPTRVVFNVILKSQISTSVVLKSIFTSVHNNETSLHMSESESPLVSLSWRFSI